MNEFDDVRPMSVILDRENTIDSKIGVQVDGTICASTSPYTNKEEAASNELPNIGTLSAMETAVKSNKA